MNTLKKLSLVITLMAISLTLAFSLTACKDKDGDDQGDANWDKKTYVFYVYLEDGVTPVEGAYLSVCYNLSETASTCSTPKKTDANGRVEIKIDDFVGTPCVHFMREDELPTGFGLPSGGQKIDMNDGSSYDYAWNLTKKETKFNLSKTI